MELGQPYGGKTDRVRQPSQAAGFPERPGKDSAAPVIRRDGTDKHAEHEEI